MIDPQHHYDPLLECVVIFARMHSRPISVEALISGLPVEPGADGPELCSIDSPRGLFSRVAARAGFVSRLIPRDLDKLSACCCRAYWCSRAVTPVFLNPLIEKIPVPG